VSFFTDPQVEAMAGAESICLVNLFKIELASGTVFAAESASDFTDGAGQVWQGVKGGIISYDDIVFGEGVAAQKRTYTLSGLSDSALAASFIDMEAEYRGRKISQLVQLCLPDGQPVNVPLVLSVMVMDKLTFSISSGGGARLVLSSETQFAIKNRSVLGFYTDTDQRSRYTDDAGLDLVKALSRGEAVRWPDF